MSMSNNSFLDDVGLAIDIIHKNRGYCSFFCKSPEIGLYAWFMHETVDTTEKVAGVTL